ncbi:MAG: CRTAC1 family protein [Acidobacteriota bacterium]
MARFSEKWGNYWETTGKDWIAAPGAVDYNPRMSVWRKTGVTSPWSAYPVLILSYACLVLVAASPGKERRLSTREALPLRFTDVTREAGLDYDHGFKDGANTDPKQAIGGVAAGDFDGDRLVDLYLVRGDIGPNLLLRNRGDGSFEEVAEAAGLDLRQTIGSGPTFGDYDGDGWLDLVIGGVEGTPPRVFRNRGDSTFAETTAETGITAQGDTFSAAFGDYDRDGYLDLFLTHWMGQRSVNPEDVHLWRNQGDGRFEPRSDEQLGLTGYREKDFTLSPNFADLNNDGWPDLVVTGDFGTSKVFLNLKDGTFTNITDSTVVTDENGMGAAVADFDNDGDLDWFISSIWDPNQGFGWGTTGNRLYSNRGDGTLEDVTSQAGVRIGYWGWGSCFEDFDNDGNLDLFHVNGFVPLPNQRDVPETDPPGQIFWNDPSRLFMSNGDGTFTEESEEIGLEDRGQGRGVVCFDYDRDGDVDIFVANNSGRHKLYRNEGGNRNHFLTVRLRSRSPNSRAVGARIYVRTRAFTQMRETQAGSNYVSQHPDEVYFGLGEETRVNRLTVNWPSGRITTYRNLPSDQLLVIHQNQQPGSSAWTRRRH